MSSASHEFRRVTSLRHLQEIFEERIVRSTVRGRDGDTVAAVMRDLGVITRDLSVRCRAGTYRFTAYRQRLLLRGAGKAPREISIPTVRDRITGSSYLWWG